MSDLVVFLPAPPPRKRAKMVIRTESRSLVYTARYAPQGHTRDNEAPQYVEIDRPGLTPIVVRSSVGLPHLQFSLRIARKHHSHYLGRTGRIVELTSVESDLAMLRKIAESRERIVVENYGPSGGGYWRLDSLSFDTTLLHPVTNEVIDTVANITLRRASDLPTSFTSSATSNRSAKARTYIWRKGDTLQKVSQKFYGTTKKWRVIADANKIRDARRVKPGRRLTIPAT